MPATVAQIVLRILDIIYLEMQHAPPEQWAQTWERRQQMLQFWTDIGTRLGGAFTPEADEKAAVTP